jgi:hypothetical protein
MHDAADHPAIVNPRHASRVCWKQRLQPGKLLGIQPEYLAHYQASSLEAYESDIN